MREAEEVLEILEEGDEGEEAEEAEEEEKRRRKRRKERRRRRKRYRGRREDEGETAGTQDAGVEAEGRHAQSLMLRRARHAERRAGKRKVTPRNRESKVKKLSSLLDGEVSSSSACSAMIRGELRSLSTYCSDIEDRSCLRMQALRDKILEQAKANAPPPRQATR
eukprot:6642471-Prymnesium_polylepis.2